MKFKKGQKVKCVVKGCVGYGRQGVITEVGEDGIVSFCEEGRGNSGVTYWDKPNHLRLVISPKEVSMPPIYILMKEAPGVKKGAVLEVKGCYQNGDYHYGLQDETDEKFPDGKGEVGLGREVVEKQPDWFEKVELVPVPLNKMAQVKKILKGK